MARLVGGVVVLAIVVEIAFVWTVFNTAPPGFWTWYVPIGGAFAWMGLALVLSGARIYRRPTRHPRFDGIRNDASTPSSLQSDEELDNEIDAVEAALPSARVFATLTWRKVYLCEGWLVTATTIIRLREIRRVMPHTTRYSVNHIPVGSEAKVALLLSTAPDEPLVVGVEKPDALMRGIEERAPWTRNERSTSE